MISDKVRPHHLERKAILYVRQSSAHQVLHNREIGALQYAMRDRLTALGWSEIEVIDDDLGRSAAGGIPGVDVISLSYNFALRSETAAMSPSATNKIALFIDGANLYATAKTLGFDIDYKRLLKEFQSRGTLLRAFYYTAIIEDQEYSSIRPLID
ncbi:hypothetical protein ACVIW2_000113 [Bradyrhizobium huanghuaihaiense]|nr:hypothetical protein [Bradyrhizobium elkanii]MCP1737767.1 hypothetical protein [Bradyrhizobium elkanii]MCS3575926.1 hypothetical protein [Bradyrhizobium elkanii]MCS3594736.1 hypothetical protein [Bradyrhizobium elkanii]MCS3625930.1 hypothetical protein [Bradyrhizobium elkanii]